MAIISSGLFYILFDHHSRQIAMPAHYRSIFYRPVAFLDVQTTL